MLKSRLMLAGLVVAAGLGVSACATDGYYGGGYGGYGGYYGDYYDYNGGYWDDGGLYYDPSYYGWYGNYYYPGTGVYVYDRNHNRHRWNDAQRRYWQNRGHNWRGQRPDNGNWDRFPHHPAPHGGSNGSGHWNGGGHWGGSHDGGHHSGGHRSDGDSRGHRGGDGDSGRHSWGGHHRRH
ncbi:hypothetical protein [Hephaestia mangrovi]|uniref:hypothetical protein n=1 Tax=Hephaestia mangrovi TaxID=2873268 RepID=UPI001CA71797|nr:hypothetical protein [Hephaestia mangrovi]MBY8828608.1 hypothetical protein [Hephaestia mangrovi]